MQKPNRPASIRAKPRTNHIALAQRILDVARQRGFHAGDRLPEQALAALCNVSRTPVRAALRLLEEQGIAERETGAGYRLRADPSAQPVPNGLPAAEEDDLAGAILRDRVARRLDGMVTVGALMRRYSCGRRTVLNALKKLADDNIVVRAPGQAWLFRPSPDSAEALAESYDFRLLMEPAAILAPGFRLDRRLASELRRGMEALLARPDSDFAAAEFQRLDAEFHGLVAEGCGNRFVADALGLHIRLRHAHSAYASVNVYRLRQSLREHLGILDQLEAGQHEIAAELMKVHLRLSRAPRPQAAGRGVPVLVGALPRRSP